jgi:hypothetical protein
MREALADLPIRFYSGDWTIEGAASDLAGWAKLRAEADPAGHPHGPRAMLGIDSIQTVQCAADVQARLAGRELSEVAAVTARVHAVRSAATRHRLIAIATSEMGRGAYRSSDPSQQTSALASGKWSGAIEYSGRVVLALRSVSGETDLVEVELAKNKHGPRDVKLYAQIDRPSQTLTEALYDPPPDGEADERRDGKSKARALAAAAEIVRVLRATPGLGVRDLRSAVRAKTGWGNDTIDTGATCLGIALVKGKGPKNSTPMTIDEGSIPAAVSALLQGGV